MIKNIKNILSKFTFKNIFGTITKRFFKIFFSDRRTATILKFLGLIFGGFRAINALLGFLVLINLDKFKTLKDLPEVISVYYKVLRNNIYQAINKFWPTHPSIPQEISKSIKELDSSVASHKVYKEEVHSPIVETLEQPFYSLRKLYNKYTPASWKDFIDSTFNYNTHNDYSVFTDWKFYIGCVLLQGLLYVLVPFAYSKWQSSSLSHKKDLDAPGAAEAISEDIIPVRFFKSFYRFISSIVQRITPNSRNLPETPK